MNDSHDKKRDSEQRRSRKRKRVTIPKELKATVNIDSTPVSGAILDERYEIIDEIGRGGMGIVYRALDQELEMDVAIKILPPELAASKRAIGDLKKEARLAMKLRHPGIVALYNFAHLGTTKYLVMEYLKGRTLDEYLHEEEMLSPDEVISLMLPLAQALEHAHSQNIIHRDIKPDNIFLHHETETSPVQVRLMDFGIARQIRESMTRLTRNDNSGTLLYMPPEQMEGKDTDHRADIYSLAATIYECISGTPPFYKGAISYQIANTLPSPIADLPEQFNAILLKALSKDANDRFSSATEFVEGLKKALESPAPSLTEEVDTQKEEPDTTVSEAEREAADTTASGPSEAVTQPPTRDQSASLKKESARIESSGSESSGAKDASPPILPNLYYLIRYLCYGVSIFASTSLVLVTMTASDLGMSLLSDVFDSEAKVFLLYGMLMAALSILAVKKKKVASFGKLSGTALLTTIPFVVFMFITANVSYIPGFFSGTDSVSYVAIGVLIHSLVAALILLNYTVPKDYSSPFPMLKKVVHYLSVASLLTLLQQLLRMIPGFSEFLLDTFTEFPLYTGGLYILNAIAAAVVVQRLPELSFALLLLCASIVTFVTEYILIGVIGLDTVYGPGPFIAYGAVGLVLLLCALGLRKLAHSIPYAPQADTDEMADPATRATDDSASSVHSCTSNTLYSFVRYLCIGTLVAFAPMALCLLAATTDSGMRILSDLLPSLNELAFFCSLTTVASSFALSKAGKIESPFKLISATGTIWLITLGFQFFIYYSHLPVAFMHFEIPLIVWSEFLAILGACALVILYYTTPADYACSKTMVLERIFFYTARGVLLSIPVSFIRMSRPLEEWFFQLFPSFEGGTLTFVGIGLVLAAIYQKRYAEVSFPILAIYTALITICCEVFLWGVLGAQTVYDYGTIEVYGCMSTGMAGLFLFLRWAGLKLQHTSQSSEQPAETDS